MTYCSGDLLGCTHGVRLARPVEEQTQSRGGVVVSSVGGALSEDEGHGIMFKLC